MLSFFYKAVHFGFISDGFIDLLLQGDKNLKVKETYQHETVTSVDMSLSDTMHV